MMSRSTMRRAPKCGPFASPAHRLPMPRISWYTSMSTPISSAVRRRRAVVVGEYDSSTPRDGYLEVIGKYFGNVGSGERWPQWHE